MQVDLGSRRGRESHLRKSQAFEAVGRSVVLRDRKVRRQVCRLTWSHPDKASTPPMPLDRRERDDPLPLTLTKCSSAMRALACLQLETARAAAGAARPARGDESCRGRDLRPLRVVGPVFVAGLSSARIGLRSRTAGPVWVVFWRPRGKVCVIGPRSAV